MNGSPVGTLWNRKLFIIGYKIRLITTEENFKEKLDWVEHVINQTNKAVDEYYRSIEAAKELEIKRTAWEDKVAIERMREILLKKFSQA